MTGAVGEGLLSTQPPLLPSGQFKPLPIDLSFIKSILGWSYWVKIMSRQSCGKWSYWKIWGVQGGGVIVGEQSKLWLFIADSSVAGRHKVCLIKVNLTRFYGDSLFFLLNIKCPVSFLIYCIYYSCFHGQQDARFIEIIKGYFYAVIWEIVHKTNAWMWMGRFENAKIILQSTVYINLNKQSYISKIRSNCICCDVVSSVGTVLLLNSWEI